MRKYFMYAIFFVCFVSCSQKKEKPKEDLGENDLKEAKYWNDMFYAEQTQYRKDSLRFAGERQNILRSVSESKNQNKMDDFIGGDFDGNGTKEYAFISPTCGLIAFTDENLEKVFDLGKLDGKNTKLFNEGDLNNDGADDFSVYIYGARQNILYIYIYDPSTKWLKASSLIFNSNEKLSDEEINSRVFEEDNQIFCYDEEFANKLSKDIVIRKCKLILRNLKNHKKE
jgi:hypothetical protein